VRQNYWIIYNEKSIRLELRIKSLEKKKLNYQLQVISFLKSYLDDTHNILFSNDEETSDMAITLLNKLISEFPTAYLQEDRIDFLDLKLKKEENDNLEYEDVSSTNSELSIDSASQNVDMPPQIRAVQIDKFLTQFLNEILSNFNALNRTERINLIKK
jgi:hypothetical protein